MIDVNRLGRDDWEKLIELLVLRKHQREDPGVVTTAIEGRGGDGGIDIDVKVRRTNALIKIYQLKHFPEGFSGEWRKTRHAQIAKSFNKAMQHRPPVWVLATPSKISVNERKWLTLLAKDHAVRVEFLGLTETNNLLALDKDAADFAERDARKDALRIVARDSAALIDPQALVEEVRRLAAKADARSAYWGTRFTADGSSVMESVFAKRPDAAEREPLSIDLEIDFTKHPQLHAAWKRMMEFGTDQPVILPPEVVKKFQKIGPEWFAETLSEGSLEIHPTSDPQRNDPTRIRVQPRTSGPSRSITGTTTWSVSGTAGGIVKMVLTGGVTMMWTLSFDVEGAAQVNVGFAPAGHGVHDVRHAIAFLEALGGASLIELEIAGHKMKLTTPAGGKIEIGQATRELLDDLTVIERETGARFAFPDNLGDVNERIWARVIRGVVEDRCMLIPDVKGFNFTLNGTESEGLTSLLATGGAIVVGRKEVQHELYGETVHLDELLMFMPAVHVPSGADHLAALQAGTAGGRRVDIEAADGIAGVRVYRPRPNKPNEPIEVEPWGIEGIEEHRELRTSEEITSTHRR